MDDFSVVTAEWLQRAWIRNCVCIHNCIPFILLAQIITTSCKAHLVGLSAAESTQCYLNRVRGRH